MGVISVHCLLKKTYGVLSNVFLCTMFLFDLKLNSFVALKVEMRFSQQKNTSPNITDCFDATPLRSGSRYLSKDYVDVYSHNFSSVTSADAPDKPSSTQRFVKL